DPNDPGPPDEVYAQSYTIAFESYCWNCVAVRAKKLDAQCPSTCRGLSAVELGCTAGAEAADFSIDKLIRRVGREKAQRKLKTLAADPVAKEKAEKYFPNGPEEEKPAPEKGNSPQ